MRIDLQVHSNYSDGYLSPTEAAKFIARHGVKVAALTDHNTVHGQSEFQASCKRLGIKTINGIEIYSNLRSRKMNVLWFNYDKDHPDFHSILRTSQIKRKKKVRHILRKLEERGFEMDVNSIVDKYHYYIPVNHIVDDLMKSETNLNLVKKELGTEDPFSKDLIEYYFRNKNIWVLNESYIDLKKLLHMKKKIGGQIIICHPAKHHYYKESFWKELKDLGVDGIEILSPHHSYNAVMYLQRVAVEYDFITTGGSDFHLAEGGNKPIQYSWQYFKIDHKLLRKINKIIGQI